MPGGATVLSARGVERETSIPFAVLQELFRNHEATLAEIPEPRAAALAGALALRGPAPSDRFAVAAATLSLLGALAGGGSLLVVDRRSPVGRRGVDRCTCLRGAPTRPRGNRADRDGT